MLIEGRDVTLYLPLTEGKDMNFSLERQGRWVLLTLPDCPECVLGLWESVAEEVPDVSVKVWRENTVKVHGPTEQAIWTVWLFFHLAEKHAPVIGYEFDKALVDESLAELIREIKKARGFE